MISKDRENLIQTVLLIIRREAIVGEFHRASVTAQPEIATNVFVQGGDVVITQAVSLIP